MKLADMKENDQENMRKVLDLLLENMIKGSNETGNQLVRYLLLINAGGTIAMMGYIGTYTDGIPGDLTLFCLKAFLWGVLFSGGVAICRHFQATKALKLLAEHLQPFWEGDKGFSVALMNFQQELQGNLLTRGIYLFGCLSFLAFILAVARVIYSF